MKDAQVEINTFFLHINLHHAPWEHALTRIKTILLYNDVKPLGALEIWAHLKDS